MRYFMEVFMVRRDFLKLGVVLSAAMLVQFSPLSKMKEFSVEAQVGGRVYRGTSDGRIYVSENAGKTWQIHTAFGSEFSVLDLSADLHENIHTLLGFSGSSFQLTCSSNDKVWRTV
jgi:hypothetical protein